MVQSPSWEANWFAASQQILRISRNPKVHYRTHKRPPPVLPQGQVAGPSKYDNELYNCPTRCDLFSLLHFCRQLYMFRVLTPIIRSWYRRNYSFLYWLTGSTTIRSRCWVGTDSCVSYGTYSFVLNEYVPYIHMNQFQLNNESGR